MNSIFFTLVIIIANFIYGECAIADCIPVNTLLKADQSYDCCEVVTCEDEHVTEM